MLLDFVIFTKRDTISTVFKVFVLATDDWGVVCVCIDGWESHKRFPFLDLNMM